MSETIEEATEYLVKYYADLLDAVGLKVKIIISTDFNNQAVFVNNVYMGSFNFHADNAVCECLASMFRVVTDPALMAAVNLETEEAKTGLHDFYGDDYNQGGE